MTRACPWCSAQIADEAQVCAHCGRTQPGSPLAAEEARRDGRRSALIWVAVIAVLVVGAIWVVLDANDDASDKARDDVLCDVYGDC